MFRPPPAACRGGGLAGGWHAQQVLFYTAKAPILITARLVYYWFKRWHYFMLDFCYFCNAALLLYLWVWPESKALFTVVFSLVNGPIAFAVLMAMESIMQQETEGWVLRSKPNLPRTWCCGSLLPDGLWTLGEALFDMGKEAKRASLALVT